MKKLSTLDLVFSAAIFLLILEGLGKAPIDSGIRGALTGALLGLFYSYAFHRGQKSLTSTPSGANR